MLKVHQNGKADLNNSEATQSVSFESQAEANKDVDINNNIQHLSSAKVTAPKILVIPRKPSRWQFQEKLTDTLARFDQSRFDRNVFFKPIPPTTIKIDWNAKLLAAFEIKIPSNALAKNGLAKEEHEEAINNMKAVGVRSILTLEKENETELKV